MKALFQQENNIFFRPHVFFSTFERAFEFKIKSIKSFDAYEPGRVKTEKLHIYETNQIRGDFNVSDK